MNYYEQFVSNLDASLIESDITSPLGLPPISSGADILKSDNQQLLMRVRRLHEIFYQKEGSTPQMQLMQLKAILNENFPSLFVKKASLFKTLVSEKKFIDLAVLLSETNRIDLLSRFYSIYPASIIQPKMNQVLVQIVSQISSDEKIVQALAKVLELYKIEDLSDFKNILDLATFKGLPATAKFFQQKMGLNLSNFNAYDLIFKFLCSPNLDDKDRAEASSSLKGKLSELTSSDWDLLFNKLVSGEEGAQSLANFKADGKNFYDYCKDLGIDLYAIKDEQGIYKASKATLSWQFLKTFPGAMSKEQVFGFAVQMSSNAAPTKSHKSIIAYIKEYLEITESSEKIIDLIPEFPILWWGCEKNKKKYTLVSFWKGLEFSPEIIPYLSEGKAQNLAANIFGEKGSFYTKLISEILNNGAASGEIEWEKLAYLKELNKILNNRDDFQAACLALDNAGMTDKSYQNYLYYFNFQRLSGGDFFNVVNTLSKEAKIRFFTTKAEFNILHDTQAMMKRLAIMRVDYHPSQKIENWKQYHDFLIAENAKIKTKGIKLDQEFLKPHLHDKILSGYKVHIPLFSEDFVWAGDSLGICVGSAGYDRKVASRGSNIMFLLEGDKVRYVIEFTHERILQAVGRENSSMPGVSEILVQAFLKENWWNNPKRTFKNDYEPRDYYEEDDFNEDQDEEYDD